MFVIGVQKHLEKVNNSTCGIYHLFPSCIYVVVSEML